MSSELVSHLTELLERWDTLSAEAAQRVEVTGRPIQEGFYAGILFGMDVARDELAAALANAMIEAAKPTASFT